MQWGGSLGTITDVVTNTSVTVRSFGSFELAGDPEALRPAILAAVTEAARGYGNVLAMLGDPEGVTVVAQAALAKRGIVGTLAIAALSIGEDDREALVAAVEAAARAALER